jgi:hypothetical protein
MCGSRLRPYSFGDSVAFWPYFGHIPEATHRNAAFGLPSTYHEDFLWERRTFNMEKKEDHVRFCQKKQVNYGRILRIMNEILALVEPGIDVVSQPAPRVERRRLISNASYCQREWPQKTRGAWSPETQDDCFGDSCYQSIES